MDQLWAKVQEEFYAIPDQKVAGLFKTIPDRTKAVIITKETLLDTKFVESV